MFVFLFRDEVVGVYLSVFLFFAQTLFVGNCSLQEIGNFFWWPSAPSVPDCRELVEKCLYRKCCVVLVTKVVNPPSEGVHSIGLLSTQEKFCIENINELYIFQKNKTFEITVFSSSLYYRNSCKRNFFFKEFSRTMYFLKRLMAKAISTLKNTSQLFSIFPAKCV